MIFYQFVVSVHELMQVRVSRNVFIKFFSVCMRKGNFYFSNFRIARIYVKKSFSNFFVTLADMTDKVIFGFSSGVANSSFSKRQKLSPYAMESIFKLILVKLRLYRIRGVELFIKMRANAPVFFLVRELRQCGFRVIRIIMKRRPPHNGVRKRKKARK